jgi:hypothetical protein
MPKTTTSTNYTLLNWNCPRRLKTQLSAIVDYKRVSRTSIINTLLDDYCRNETAHIEKDGEILSMIEHVQGKVTKPKVSPPVPEMKSTRSDKWESSYI